MKLQEFHTVKTCSHVNVPFSTVWSQDNHLAVASEKGVLIVGGVFNRMWALTLFSILLIGFPCTAHANDITQSVFGTTATFVPAGFGDFNADEYTDLIVIHNDKRKVEVLLGSDSEPLLRHSTRLNCTMDKDVTSVVPGDFDGDALLDVMVTVRVEGHVNSVRILWGNLTALDCSDKNKEMFQLKGQPLSVDFDSDMIVDLFGEDTYGNKSFWVFNKTRALPKRYPLIQGNDENRKFAPLRHPHSNAFLDLNRDSFADLYLTTKDSFEVWLYQDGNFIYDPKNVIPLPPEGSKMIVGQTLFVNLKMDGNLDHVVPVCMNKECTSSAIFVYSKGHWYDLKVNFHDNNNKLWNFVKPSGDETDYFTNAITLHMGDYNMDGYPDVLATLTSGKDFVSFMFENVECSQEQCNGFPRSFKIQWDLLKPYNKDTLLGVFFDFAQNGVLDILFVHKTTASTNSLITSAFKNNLDYDANFVKVMVLSGKVPDSQHSEVPTPLRRMRKIYGTSFPGPVIWYYATTQEGNKQESVSTQLAQSAYFSLQQPYTLFGLGRSPNFVDTLHVGLCGFNRTWYQIIPNSQIVVIPKAKNPRDWIVQLFVTPSKIIIKTIIALLGTCLLISIIIIILWWKERREDHLEKLQEAHRFHFDAM